MLRNQERVRRCRWPHCVLAVAVGLAMVAADGAAAREREPEREYEKLPGYVDISGFAELADDSSKLIEVSIHGPLLKVLSRAASAETGGVPIFAGIKSINAVIIGEVQKMDQAKKLMRKVVREMDEKGWERIALVRESDELVLVYVHLDEKGEEELIDGLTVMVKDSDADGELVVVNIAGHIDLSQMGGLAGTIHIPGLDKVPREKVPHVVIKKSRGTSEEAGKQAQDDEEKEEDEDW